MQIPFYHDYACPWAYLGSCRVEAYFSDLGVDLDFRPVRLADLKEPTTGTAPQPGARKKKAYRDDLLHWAELCDAEFSPHAREARADTRLLLQAALVAKDAGRLREFHYPAYRARWAEARDVADPELVSRLLAGAGLEPGSSLEQARSDALAARLDADTREAIERGVFGVPTVFVGDEMFWGNDRFELARHYIRKTLE